MKIAILYICTGSYSRFWSDFYISCEEYFLNGIEKEYFVFSDMDPIPKSNVNFIFKEYEGFPLDSLNRFKIFYSIECDLRDFDYIFFFNANMLFLSSIGIEVLPQKEHNYLVSLVHPGYVNKTKRFLPFERNINSTAFIPLKKGVQYRYFQGCLNGGRSSEYLDLILNCYQNIETDLSKSIIARAHDESHLNRFLFNKNILELGLEYGFPENWNRIVNPKIIQIDKYRIFPNFRKKGVLDLWKQRLVRLKNILFWTRQ